MESFLQSFFEAVLYVIPAYVANAVPVITVKILGRATPIDGGRIAWDGRRWLGDGKTWEGLGSGIFFGAIIGLLIHLSLKIFRSPAEPLLLGIGAMIGDIGGAFVKRRIGLERGAPFPVVDQLGFLAAALILASLVYDTPTWMRAETLVGIFALTFVLHLGTNAAAYILGLKDKPY